MAMDHCSFENKSGYMLGYPVDPPVLAVKSTAVTIREVRAISRKGRIGKWVRNPQRPYAGPADPSRGMIWSDLYGDIQSATEMSAPPSELEGSNRMNGPKVAKFLVG